MFTQLIGGDPPDYPTLDPQHHKGPLKEDTSKYSFEQIWANSI